MRKGILPIFMFLVLVFFSLSCQKQPEQKEGLFMVGYFQVIDSPTATESRKGFIQALEDNGLSDSENISLNIQNGMGDMIEVQKIAGQFVENHVDMIVASSTPCLQAALMATQKIPIIFIAVANPYLTGAGKSPDDHLAHVTGVASTGPVKETLAFIKEVLPHVKRIGTLWTPSELNSEYYLNLAREGADELGLEIVEVPISNPNEILLSAQVLVNKRIDVIFPISDNTINASFGAIGRVAEENAIPLFGGFLLSTEAGACSALGWDFFDMGYKAGQIFVQVKNGESPGRIPFQSMSQIKLHLNMEAAKKQGVEFPASIIQRADKILGMEEGGGKVYSFR